MPIESPVNAKDSEHISRYRLTLFPTVVIVYRVCENYTSYGDTMFERLKSVFVQPGVAGDVNERDDTGRIRIATAVILLEVANSDDEFSDEERDTVISILKDSFRLSEEEVSELLAVSTEEREGSVDMWHFANIINENYTEEEKFSVMDNIWRVIYADGKLDKYEDHIVHKLAAILHIPHSQMIEAKLKYLPGE